MSDKKDFVTLPSPDLTIGERWCNSFTVTYPVSYSYNGGFIHYPKTYGKDGVWKQGFKVDPPIIPEGFKTVGIACGLQLNAQPPFATVMIVPTDDPDRKVSKSELKAAIKNAR
jgi:hypothetical protein